VRIFAIVLLSLLVTVGAVLVPTMWFNLRDLRETETAARAAVAEAKRLAPDLLSYDYRTIEEDLARAGTFTTGELTEHYKELTRTLVSRAKEQKIVQSVAVAAAGIERAKPDRVEVLLFVNTGTVKEIPGKEGLQQEFTQNRARFVMVRQDSRWLVAGLSTLLGTA
jgi:Mce-associated membrane protein